MAVVSSEEIRSFLTGGSVSLTSDSLNTTIIGGTTSTGMGRNPFAFRLSHSTNQWRAVKLIPPSGFVETMSAATAADNENHIIKNNNGTPPVWPPFRPDSSIASIIYRDQLLVFGGRMSTILPTTTAKNQHRRRVTITDLENNGVDESKLQITDNNKNNDESDDGVDWGTNPQINNNNNNNNNNTNKKKKNDHQKRKNSHRSDENDVPPYPGADVHNCVLVVPLNGWKTEGGPDKAAERLSRAAPLHEPTQNKNNTQNNSSPQQPQQQQQQDIGGFIGASAAFVCAKVEDFGLSSIPGSAISCLQACCDEDTGIAFLLCEYFPAESDGDQNNNNNNNNGTADDEPNPRQKKTQKKRSSTSDDDDNSISSASDSDDDGRKKSTRKRATKKKSSSSANKKSTFAGGHCLHIVDLRNRVCLTANTPLTLPRNVAISSSSSSSLDVSCSLAFDSKARTLLFHLSSSEETSEKLFLLPLPPALFARDGDIVPATNNYANLVISNSSSSLLQDDGNGGNNNNHNNFLTTPKTIDPDDVQKFLDEGRLSNWLTVNLGDAPMDVTTGTFFLNTAASQSVTENMGNYLTGGAAANQQQQLVIESGKNSKNNNINASRPETAPTNKDSSKNTTTTPQKNSNATATNNNTNQKSNNLVVPPGSASSSSSRSKSPQRIVQASNSNNKSTTTPSASLILISSDSCVRYDFDCLRLIDELLHRNKNNNNSNNENNNKLLDDENTMFPVKGSSVEGIKSLNHESMLPQEEEEENKYQDDDEFEEQDDKKTKTKQNQQKDNNNKSKNKNFVIRRCFISKIGGENNNNNQRLMFFGGPFPIIPDFKLLEAGEKSWKNFYSATFVAPTAHFAAQLTRLPKRLSPERQQQHHGNNNNNNTSQYRPGTSSAVITRNANQMNISACDLPKVTLRSRNIEENNDSSSSPYLIPVSPRAIQNNNNQHMSPSNNTNNNTPRPPTSARRNQHQQSSTTSGSRPPTSADHSNALIVAPNNAVGSPRSGAMKSGATSATTNINNNNQQQPENLPAHRSTLSRMMLRVEPTEENIITRSRVKTLIRGGHMSDDALQNLAKTLSDRTAAEAMLESGHDEPIRVDCAVDAQHPHTSTVSIEGNTLPVDVHVLASYATNEDDTTIAVHWLDAQRLISVQLIQHIRVGEARKRELTNLQHELRDEKRDLARQRAELHDEKEKLLEIGEELDQRSDDLDARERDLDQRQRDLDDARLQHEKEVDDLAEQKEAFEDDKRRQEEIEKEHERRRRLEAERQRNHERTMEAELRRQEILNDQLQRQAEGAKASSLKLEKETEKILREREQFKKDLATLRQRESTWQQEQKQFETTIAQLQQDIKDRQAGNEQLHKQLKEAQRAEANTREQLETAVKVIEYFDGRRSQETDTEWQRRKEQTRKTEEMASQGIFYSKTTVANAAPTFQIHTNSGRSVVAHVRDSANSTQLLPQATLVSDVTFSLRAGSYLEVEVGEGFCLGDVLFVNPSALVLAKIATSEDGTTPPNSAQRGAGGGGGGILLRRRSFTTSPSSGSPFGSFKFGSAAEQANAENNNNNTNAEPTAWFITNPKGIKVAQCMFDPQRRDLDALRFLLMPSASADLTVTTIEAVLRSIMFHTPTNTFTGTRTVEFSLFVVSARIHHPGAHCWMEINVVVVDQPLEVLRRPPPFVERGKAVAVMSHCKPLNPFAGWLTGDQQMKFAEEHAYFGTKGYNMAKLMNGTSQAYFEDPENPMFVRLGSTNSMLGNNNNSNTNGAPAPAAARNRVGFLGDSTELLASGDLMSASMINNNNNNVASSFPGGASSVRRHQTEEDFFREITYDENLQQQQQPQVPNTNTNNATAAAEFKDELDSNSGEPTSPLYASGRNLLKPPVDPSLRRLSPPSLEVYLQQKGPLAVRRCPTCTQMRRLPRFVIHGKDKDVVSQYAVEAVGTHSQTQHNANTIKTSTGNAAMVIGNAIEAASAMPEQWAESVFVFSLQKIQPEDCLVIGENSDVKRAKDNGDITIELNKPKDVLTVKIESGRGVPVAMLTSILHLAHFQSTASPLASASRFITLTCEFPHLIIPLRFSKTAEIPIINAPYHVEVDTERSRWPYYFNSVGIPDAKFDPAPLFFASHITVKDELGLKFEGKAQLRIESPALRRDQLRLVVHPDYCEGSANSNNNGAGLLLKIEIRENQESIQRKARVSSVDNNNQSSAITPNNNNNNKRNSLVGINRVVSFTASGNNNNNNNVASSGNRRKSKIFGRELETLFDTSGQIIVNGEVICDFEVSDMGCTIRYKFHRTTNIGIARAVLRCVVFETVDSNVGHRKIVLTTSLGRGNMQKTYFDIDVRPGLLVIGRMGCIKWVENQPPSLATSQIALLDPSKTPQQFTIQISISSGFEKGDVLDVRQVLKNARSTTVALPGKAGAPNIVLAGRNRNSEVVQGWRILDSVFVYFMQDSSIVAVFAKDSGVKGRRATVGATKAAREEEERKRQQQAALEASILDNDPFAVLPHQRPDKILKLLGNVIYIHNSKAPKFLKKVLRVRAEDLHGVFSDCLLPVNVVPIDDPTDVNNVAWRTLYAQNTYEAQRGLQIAPEAALDDPDTDDFVGGFLSVEPVGRVSVRDELYILPVAEQIRRMLDGIVYIDDRNRVYVFDDAEEYEAYKEELAKLTESGATPTEAVTQCCVGVMRRVKMPDGLCPVVDGNQFVNAAEDGTTEAGAPSVAMTNGGEVQQVGSPGSTTANFAATKLEFCFTPSEPRLIPLEDVQAVLRAIAFRNDSTRISRHRRHYLIRLGAGVVNIESNSYEDTMEQSIVKKNTLTLAAVGDSDESENDAAISEEDHGLKVADHTQVPISLKVVPGVFHIPPIARHHRYIRNTPAIFPARAIMILPLYRHINLARSTLVVRLVSDRDANSPPPAQIPNAQLVSAAMSLHRSMSMQKMKRDANNNNNADGSSPGSPGSPGSGTDYNRKPSFSNILGEYLTPNLNGEDESINFAPSKASGLELSNGTKVLGFSATRTIATMVTLTPTALMFQFDATMDAKHLQNLMRAITYTAVSTNQDQRLPGRSTLLAFDLYDSFSYPKNTKYDCREDSDDEPDMSEYPEPGPLDIKAQEEQKQREREERKRLKKEAKKKKKLEEAQKQAAFEETKGGAAAAASVKLLANNKNNSSSPGFGNKNGDNTTQVFDTAAATSSSKKSGGDNNEQQQDDVEELDTPPNETTAAAASDEKNYEQEGFEDDGEETELETPDPMKIPQPNTTEHNKEESDDDDDDDEEIERPLRSKIFEYNTVFSTSIAIHIVDADASKQLTLTSGGTSSYGTSTASSTTTAQLSTLIAAGFYVPTSIIVSASGGTEYPTDNYFLTMNFLPPNPPAEYITKSTPSPIFRFAQMSWTSSDPRRSGKASSIILGPPAALIVSLPAAASGHLTIFEDPLLRCAKTDMRHNYRISACPIEPEEVSLVTERAAQNANAQQTSNIRLSKQEQEHLDEEAAFARAVRTAAPFRAAMESWDPSKRTMSYANILEATLNDQDLLDDNGNPRGSMLPATGAEIMPMMASISGTGGRDNGHFTPGETRELRYRGYSVALYTPPTKAGGSLRFDFLACPASILLEILRHIHYVAGSKDKLRPGSRVSVNLCLLLQPQLLDAQNAGLTVVVTAPIVDDLPVTPIVFSPTEPAKCFAAVRVRNVSGFGGGNLTVDLECDARQMHKISNKDFVLLDDAVIQNVCTFTIKRKPGNIDSGEVLMTSYQYQTPVVFGTFTLSPHSLHIALGPKSGDRNFPQADVVQSFLRHCVQIGSGNDYSEKAPTRADALSKFLCNLAVEDGSGNTSSGHVVMQAALPKNYTKGAGPRMRKPA